MKKRRITNKTCVPEKKRPEYKPKPKNEYEYEMIPFEIHMLEGIPYVIIGDLPYAVDDKGIVTYEMTRVLRDRMKELEKNTENNT